MPAVVNKEICFQKDAKSIIPANGCTGTTIQMLTATTTYKRCALNIFNSKVNNLVTS